MLAALLFGATVLPQTINGIKPVDDGTTRYAKAFAAWSGEDPTILVKPNPFLLAYFTYRAKMMAPLAQTKYTAAHIGICGTMVGLHDEALGKAIKAPSDRITKGTKDFDTLTQAERDAIGKAMIADKGAHEPFIMGMVSPAQHWEYFAGAHLGALSAYTTLWHISPKQPELLEQVASSLKTCGEHGVKPDGSSNRPLADALKAFRPFLGKTLDEGTMRQVGRQVEEALRSTVAEKFRWEVPGR